MVHRKKVDLERTELKVVPRLYLVKVRALDAVLLQFASHKAQRELGGIDRHVGIEVGQKEREGSGVVFVAMRDDDALELMLVLKHIGVVGQEQVDTRVVVVGEHEAGVVEDHVVPVLDHGHVLADAVETAERDDAQRDVVGF